MPFWKWSHTASSNANADSTVNWAEGMAPSAINDSARTMMARLAEWRDDISGTITTAGTATAYTVSSNQGFDNFADMNGAMLAFVMHATNGGTVTLNVDGLGAKPLRSAPSTELPSGVLVQGTPYVATYNNSDGAFYLQGFSVNPYVVPIGAFLDYAGTTAPNSAFVLPYGQAISRTTYATLFALVGITFGAGDGSTTFNVPDLRGRVAVGLDNMGGSAAGRIGTALVTDSGTINGQSLGSAGGSQQHTQTTGEMPTHNHGITDPGHSHTQNPATVYDQGGGNTSSPGSEPVNLNGANATLSNTTGITINNAGGGSAMAWLQPSIMLGKILRVT